MAEKRMVPVPSTAAQLKTVKTARMNKIVPSEVENGEERLLADHSGVDSPSAPARHSLGDRHGPDDVVDRNRPSPRRLEIWTTRTRSPSHSPSHSPCCPCPPFRIRTYKQLSWTACCTTYREDLDGRIVGRDPSACRRLDFRDSQNLGIVGLTWLYVGPVSMRIERRCCGWRRSVFDATYA